MVGSGPKSGAAGSRFVIQRLRAQNDPLSPSVDMAVLADRIRQRQLGANFFAVAMEQQHPCRSIRLSGHCRRKFLEKVELSVRMNGFGRLRAFSTLGRRHFPANAAGMFGT